MFEKKIWADRIAEFINRREITHADGSTEQVTVARAEGQISQEGDAFSAQNMNDLEQRIDDAMNELFQSVSDGKALVATALTNKGVATASDATFETMAQNIGAISTGAPAYLITTSTYVSYGHPYGGTSSSYSYNTVYKYVVKTGALTKISGGSSGSSFWDDSANNTVSSSSTTTIISITPTTA